ncbi:MAG: response regulator [Minisyncoccia bacterium]
MKILIAEDEVVLYKVLEEKFKEEKFEVIIVPDGSAVMSMVKKNKPDIILLDIILPEVDGIEILSKLKEDKILREIPVIILSNLGEDQKIKQALKLGAVDYMVKSQHPIQEVVEKVREYI